ncbi:MAG: M14 family metallopeptidase [Pirellulaceae bacterium]
MQQLVFCLVAFVSGLLAISAAAQNGNGQTSEWLTVSEASDFEATCSSADVEAFIKRAADQSDNISLYQYGETVEGKPMTAVICANPPFEIGQDDDRPIALVIANIHSGECCGKEAVLTLIRDIANNNQHPWLNGMVTVFVPNYNADGNDKVALNNRPGQDGPVKGMGKRETSEGYDLNRDFVKLDSQEARNMVKLIDELNPHMFVDCHTTNGSRHQYQLTYDVPHNPSAPESIRHMMREKMMPEITSNLDSNGFKAFYYGNFDREYTTWTTYGYEPRYSTEYVGMRGRLAILSEAYSYISFKDRIDVSRAFVTECLNYLQKNSDEIIALLDETESNWLKEVAENPDSIEMHLRADLKPYEQPFDILGFDGDSPKTYSVEFVSNYIPTVSKSVPKAYVFSGDMKLIADRLRNHGIEVEELNEPTSFEVEVASIDKINRFERPFQKHFMTSLDVSFATETREFPAGAFVVKTAQPQGRLACYILESQTNEGWITWNYLDDYISEGGEYPFFRVVKGSTESR